MLCVLAKSSKCLSGGCLRGRDLLAIQENLFRVAGLPMVENCMAGYNSSMFAYGQASTSHHFDYSLSKNVNLQSFAVVLLQPTMKILAEPPVVNHKKLAAILSFKLNSPQHGVLWRGIVCLGWVWCRQAVAKHTQCLETLTILPTDQASSGEWHPESLSTCLVEF